MPPSAGRAVALVVLLTGCGGSPPKSSDGPQQPTPASRGATSDQAPPTAGASPTDGASPTTARPKEPGPPSKGHGTDELRRLEGRTEAEVLAEFGEPSTRHAFTMAHCCDEFQIELRNTYPRGKGHDAVEIHEYTWAYDGYLLTVWLHDPGKGWEVLNTLLYGDTVEF